MSGRREPRWSEFDASIRETARALWRAGFEPWSGHGHETAPVSGLNVTDVVMLCEPAQLLEEAGRLQALALSWGLPAEWSAPAESEAKVPRVKVPRVQAHYTPSNDAGSLILLGVHDELLPAAARSSP